jgi:hypothetical protein
MKSTAEQDEMERGYKGTDPGYGIGGRNNSKTILSALPELAH